MLAPLIIAAMSKEPVVSYIVSTPATDLSFLLTSAVGADGLTETYVMALVAVCGSSTSMVNLLMVPVAHQVRDPPPHGGLREAYLRGDVYEREPRVGLEYVEYLLVLLIQRCHRRHASSPRR